MLVFLSLSVLMAYAFITSLFSLNSYSSFEVIGVLSLFLTNVFVWTQLKQAIFGRTVSISMFKRFAPWLIMFSFAASSILISHHIFYWALILLMVYFVQLWSEPDQQIARMSFKLYLAAWLLLIFQLLVILIFSTSLSASQLGFLFLFLISLCWMFFPMQRFNSLKPDPDFIVFFDGECALCQKTVQFILAEDRSQSIKFAPLEGEFAVKNKIESQMSIAAREQTFVVFKNDKVFVRGEAVSLLLKQLGGVWIFARLFLLVLPNSLIDNVYRAVAQRRKIWFPKTESCALISAEQKIRVLK